MRLAQFILENMEAILGQWENFARVNQPVTGNMSQRELRDHAEAMLKVIAADLGKSQTDEESFQKSQGHAPKSLTTTPAQLHANERLRAGFSIKLMVSEYRALRASVLALWAKDAPSEPNDYEDMLRFNEAIDQALAESVENYTGLMTESQDTFLGILGHDLRAPLQSISAGAEYLMRASDNEARLIQLGARMFNSAARMDDMLNDLLDYTRIRIGGGLPIAFHEANLAQVALQIVDEFRASHPGRTLRLNADGDCSGEFDAKRIGQVYQNLIGNALQYGAQDGPVDMTLRCVGENIIFTIHNQGAPIPQSEQCAIFDPLRRHLSGSSENVFTTRNLGLGLYIAMQVALAHRGTIDLVSTDADGTTFTVTLPKHQARG